MEVKDLHVWAIDDEELVSSVHVLIRRGTDKAKFSKCVMLVQEQINEIMASKHIENTSIQISIESRAAAALGGIPRLKVRSSEKEKDLYRDYYK